MIFYVIIFYLPGNFIEIVLVGKKAPRESHCGGAENVAIATHLRRRMSQATFFILNIYEVLMSFKTNFIRFIFISVLGVLLHFTYEWSGNNPIVGLFSATNESTWEHLKLLFFPMLILTMLEIFFNSSKLPSNFLSARVIGIISGTIFIVAAFYTILGVIGTNYDFINIAIYFVGAILALVIENKQYNKPAIPSECTSFIILLILTIAFFIFTFYPPKIGLFAEPDFAAIIFYFHLSY